MKDVMLWTGAAAAYFYGELRPKESR